MFLGSIGQTHFEKQKAQGIPSCDEFFDVEKQMIGVSGRRKWRTPKWKKKRRRLGPTFLRPDRGQNGNELGFFKKPDKLKQRFPVQDDA